MKDPSASTSQPSPGSKRKAGGNAGPAAKKKKGDKMPNPLDMTCIHPESYDAARR